ncbi:MAG TPA: CBS domain-containing protein [Actinocatenispora sp.]
MAQVRDVMHRGVQCVDESETLVAAAKRMQEMHVGALPICGPDGRLTGMLTDRDIVVRCLAEGRDPATTTAGMLAQGTPVWVEAGADEREALDLMADNAIRRLPVIEDHQVVGMMCVADVAAHLDGTAVAELVASVSAAPATS